MYELTILFLVAFIITLVLLVYQINKSKYDASKGGVEIVESLPYIVWCADIYGNIIYANKQWETFAGTNTSTWTECINKQDKATLHAWSQSIKSQQSLQAEVKLQGASGVYEWFVLQADFHPQLKWPGKQSEQGVWVGSLFSIDVKRLAFKKIVNDLNTKLLDVEGKCAQIIKTAVDPIITADEVGLIHSFNDAACRMFNYTEQEVLGKNLCMLMDSAIGKHHVEYMSRYTHTGNPHVIGRSREIHAVRKDGKQIPVLLSLSDFPIGGGKHHFVGILHDITQQREALEANIKLQQAKDRLIMTVSHELRTPLNGINGAVDLLRAAFSTVSREGELLNIISLSSYNLQRVIDNMLNLFMLSNFEVPLREVLFYPRMLVDEVLSTFNSEPSTLVLSVVDHDVPQVVRSDPLKLKMILNNLLDNAIKFTKSGEVVVTVVTVPDDVSKQESSSDVEETKDKETLVNLKFIVSDTGTGIPSSANETIWAGFSQVDNSSNRRFNGAGLGLAICKKLVENMSGTIGFDSVVGEGSTFWFTTTVMVPPDPSSVPPSPTLAPFTARSFAHSPGVTPDSPCIRKDLYLGYPLSSSVGRSPTCARFKPQQRAESPMKREKEVATQPDEDFQNPVSDSTYDHETMLDYGNLSLPHVKCLVLVGNDNASHNIEEKLSRWGLNVVVATDIERVDVRKYKVLVLDADYMPSVSMYDLSDKLTIVIESPQTCALPCSTHHTLQVCHPILYSKLAFFLEKFLDCSTKQQPEANTTPSSEQPTEMDTVKNFTALIVEDNVTNQKIICKLMERLGYACEVANNGKEAFDVLEGHADSPFDVVLMDLQMPVMDGIEATKLIRAHEREKTLPRTKIYALTASSFADDKEQCFDAGMDGFFTKPISLTLLRNLLKTL